MSYAPADRTRLTDALPELASAPVIGILRRCAPELAPGAVAAAADAGVRVVEVTLDSEEPLIQIARLAALGSVVVGVGTVTRPEQVTAAVAAGARFVVSPVVDAAVVAAAIDHEVPVIPGAATPTEILEAMRRGATAVKVFPARLLGGPAFLEAVNAPLGHPPLVPTGGVDPASARAYLDAGAVALGAGGSLFPREALATGNVGAIAARAATWMRAVS